MKKIFDNYINNSFDGVKEQSYFKCQQFTTNYKKFFPKDTTHTTVLDIGVGRGEMLSCMRDWGYKNYNGIDITRSTIYYCKSINLKCEYTEDTVIWLKSRKDSFDMITLFDVIEHIKKEDVLEFLDAIHFALKKDGLVILQTPNMQSLDSNLHRWGDITHEFGLTESSFKQILIESNFRDINFYGFEWIVENKIKNKIAKILRYIQSKIIYINRKISGNLTPKILNPVFFAVAKK